MICGPASSASVSGLRHSEQIRDRGARLLEALFPSTSQNDEGSTKVAQRAVAALEKKPPSRVVDAVSTVWLPRSSVGASADAPASSRHTGRWSGRTAFPRRSVGTSTVRPVWLPRQSGSHAPAWEQVPTLQRRVGTRAAGAAGRQTCAARWQTLDRTQGYRAGHMRPTLPPRLQVDGVRVFARDGARWPKRSSAPRLQRVVDEAG